VHVNGLPVGSVVHYRVVAVSELQPGEIETLYSQDRTFTTEAAKGSFALPDGRQWELVSPANKLGALIEPPQFGGVVQAAADGGAIAYQTSSPTESDPPGGFAHEETALSTHGTAGWSSLDISESNVVPVHPGASVGKEFQIFSEDLSRAAVQPVMHVFTPLSPEASETTPYLRTDYLDGSMADVCGAGCYRPLVTGKVGYANVPPGTVFGDEPEGFCIENAQICGPKFQGASPDLSHIVLSSSAQLTATPAPAGGEGLYEWSEGRLQLLDVLPAGEEGPAILAGTYSQAMGVRRAVSDDGQRVIMEGGATGGGGVYLREVATPARPQGETVRLDVPQGGGGPSKEPLYMDASADGSRVFFLDSGKLTAGSSPSGADLYEYNVDAPAGSRLTDLSVDLHPGRASDVKMMVGASEDGSYLYFAAAGALAPGAVEGQCPREAYEGSSASKGCNLYVRHDGVTRLVAVLPSSDIYDWSTRLANFGTVSLFGRVSPDGQWFAFMSDGELTGYDTHDALSGQPDVEAYVYDAASDALACASCDPSGARPVGAKYAGNGDEIAGWLAARVPAWTEPPSNFGSLAAHQPRYLSDSGRLFFDSSDALVPQDVNGVEDVYEWEPAGIGSCSTVGATFSARSGGCVDLISSGASPEPSELIDASETGGDVFIRTQARLAPSDYDTAFDVYDVRECTSVEPCPVVRPQPPACTTESSCKTPPLPQPALYGAPASATFSGAGNIVPSSQPVVQGKAKSGSKAKSKHRKGRSVCRKQAKRRCAKAGKARRVARRASRTVGAGRGGAR
jgi:hypothetical protein